MKNIIRNPLVKLIYANKKERKKINISVKWA
jgi:hypothetical protein